MVEKKKKAKKATKTSKEQSHRFRQTVRELEAAGELDLTEAEEKFERAVRKVAKEKPT